MFGGGIGDFSKTGFDLTWNFRRLFGDGRLGFRNSDCRNWRIPFRQFPNCIPRRLIFPMTELRVTPSSAAMTLPEYPALVRATKRSVSSGVQGLLLGRARPSFRAQYRAVSRQTPSRFAASSIVGAVAQCFRRASISLSDRILSFMAFAFRL